MLNEDTVKQDTIFIKKQIKDLIDGDIILHSIYRSDGLMLIKQYKTLSNDLALKIKHLVPKNIPVIVLSPNYDLETFNQNRYYHNKALIIELEKTSEKYSEYIQIPLEKNILIDKRINIENIIKPASQQNFNEDPYIDFLCKSPFFSTFEERLESPHLQIRAKKLKENLIATILKNKVLLDKLNEIKNYKDILLLHSINTTSIALMIGLTLELNEIDLIDLALTNLLIDISVTQIPKTQFELHLSGKKINKDFYNLHLNELKKLSEKLPFLRKESIIYGILDHYEYYNGNGFPKGKKGSDISLFGRIILISQAYDEMVGGYFYNNSVEPIKALQNIWENCNNKFDLNIIRIFIDRTTLFKIGQRITLSNSNQGTIVNFSDFINSPVFPIVELQDGNTVNLLKSKIFKKK